MHSVKLKDWRAKRAGGRITVYGIDSRTGKDTKIVAVDEIKPIEGRIFAIDKNGTHHTLAI
jgi:hypothetical protein